jgi:hypothetical protein
MNSVSTFSVNSIPAIQLEKVLGISSHFFIISGTIGSNVFDNNI